MTPLFDALVREMDIDIMLTSVTQLIAECDMATETVVLPSLTGKLA